MRQGLSSLNMPKRATRRSWSSKRYELDAGIQAGVEAKWKRALQYNP